MKSAAATLRRLLQALEDLGRREDGALACGDGLGFLFLEQRAEPLVHRLLTLAREPMDPALRERGQALVASRSERRLRLVSLLDATRTEIGRLDEARARARALRPAYASARARLSSTSSFAGCG